MRLKMQMSSAVTATPRCEHIRSYITTSQSNLPTPRRRACVRRSVRGVLGRSRRGVRFPRPESKFSKSYVNSKAVFRHSSIRSRRGVESRPIFLATCLSAMAARLMQETTEFWTSPEDFPSGLPTSIRKDAESEACRRLLVIPATMRFLILAL